VLLTIGGAVAYFGLVWAVLGILTLIYPASIEHEDYWIAIGALALLAVIPWTFAAIFVVPGIRGRRRLRRLQELAVHLRQTGRMDDDEIEQALETDAAGRERLVNDAIELGILDGVGEGAGAGIEGPVIKGSYRVERVVRADAGGGLYRVRQVRSGQAYLLRILLPDGELDAAGIRALERRALALSSMEHPVIPRIIDMDTSEQGERFMVLDLGPSRSLEDRIAAEGTMPAREALDIAWQAADAVAAAHGEALPHGQLSSRTILLASAPGGERPVLLPWDWSLAQDRAAQQGDLDALCRIIRDLIEGEEMPSALAEAIGTTAAPVHERVESIDELRQLLMDCLHAGA